MRMPKNLYVIEYTENITSTYKSTKFAMFNSNVISEGEVRECLCRGIDEGLDSRFVIMTEGQYKNLFDVTPINESEAKKFIETNFYTDLMVEQQGGII